MILTVILSVGCAAEQTPQIIRVALLAPFEGVDRDIGYEALYAARLAVADADDIWLELLPIDDGDHQTAHRARALAADPLVKVVLLIGDDSGLTDVQKAFDDLPVLIVGEWGATVEHERLFILPEERSADTAFRQRYLTSDAFVPEPGTLAQPVYDAAVAAIAAAQTGSRNSAFAALNARYG